MTRYVHNGGLRVFDDTDAGGQGQWYSFDTPEQGQAFAALGESMRHGVLVDEQAAPRIATRIVLVSNGLGVVPASGAVLILSRNPSRARATVMVNAGGLSDAGLGVILGTRAEVSAGVGMLVAPSPTRLTLETIAEVYAAPAGVPYVVAGVNTCSVSVLEEYGTQ
jgi:hypothetical protein